MYQSSARSGDESSSNPVRFSKQSLQRPRTLHIDKSLPLSPISFHSPSVVARNGGVSTLDASHSTAYFDNNLTWRTVEPSRLDDAAHDNSLQSDIGASSAHSNHSPWSQNSKDTPKVSCPDRQSKVSLSPSQYQAYLRSDPPASMGFNQGVWEHKNIEKNLDIDGLGITDLKGTLASPHHVYTSRQKQAVVLLVSFGALFSPLSANIYFPALNNISEHLHTSSSNVALTVTIYMIFQALAPSVWGPLSDTYGRRPIFICTLTLYLVSCAMLAVAPNFAVIMAFRAVQAIGSSSTISIGAGVISDITDPRDRAGYMGTFSGIRTTGLAIGPVIGGALTQWKGFRSIFWFLFILDAIANLLLLLLLPETLRSIAGDGSMKLYGIHKPLWGLIHNNKTAMPIEGVNRYKPTKLTFRMFWEPMKLLAELDVVVALLFGGIIYAVTSMIASTTSMLFKAEYNLSDVLIGLCFLPNGLGCIIGAKAIGVMGNWDYKRAAEKYCRERDLPLDTKINQQLHPDFPIERARLRWSYVLGVVFAVLAGVYGFSVEWIIAVPLTIQFFTAFTSTAILNTNNLLMTDLYPSKPASAVAINNFVRCMLGAIGVAFVDMGIEKINESWTFLTLAIIAGLSVGLVFTHLKWGPKWRNERLNRIRTEEELDRALELRNL